MVHSLLYRVHGTENLFSGEKPYVLITDNAELICKIWSITLEGLCCVCKEINLGLPSGNCTPRGQREMFASWLNMLTNSLRFNWSGSNPYREICKNLFPTSCRFFSPLSFGCWTMRGSFPVQKVAIFVLRKKEMPRYAGCPAWMPWPGRELFLPHCPPQGWWP